MKSTSISPHFRVTSWSGPLPSLVTATTIFSAPSVLVLVLLLPSSTTAQNRTFLVLPRGGGSSCQMPDTSLYYQPVIGVLSHPGDGASGRLNNGSHISNIPASYVKFVESGGARVVPIIFNEPLDAIYEKLNLVNGVLFTGGWAKKGLYYETARKIFLEVLEKNNYGGHFPLFAICLGFELLSMFVSKDRNILEKFSASAQASTLQFTNCEMQGTFFQRFPSELLEKLRTECLVMQNHNGNGLEAHDSNQCWMRHASLMYGVSPKRFLENEALSNFFKILTTSADENDKVYVSTVQAYKYPVVGLQWHPEKNAFEWGMTMIPHSEDAIQVTQHAANYLISEARKSLTRPPVEKLLDNLIYNFAPTYCGKAG